MATYIPGYLLAWLPISLVTYKLCYL